MGGVPVSQVVSVTAGLFSAGLLDSQVSVPDPLLRQCYIFCLPQDGKLQQVIKTHTVHSNDNFLCEKVF